VKSAPKDYHVRRENICVAARPSIIDGLCFRMPGKQRLCDDSIFEWWDWLTASFATVTL